MSKAKPAQSRSTNPKPKQPKASGPVTSKVSKSRSGNNGSSKPEKARTEEDGTEYGHEYRVLCIHCGSDRTKVLKNRQRRRYNVPYKDPQRDITWPHDILRRRKCLDCGKNFPTRQGFGDPKKVPIEILQAVGEASRTRLSEVLLSTPSM